VAPVTLPPEKELLAPTETDENNGSYPAKLPRSKC